MNGFVCLVLLVLQFESCFSVGDDQLATATGPNRPTVHKNRGRTAENLRQHRFSVRLTSSRKLAGCSFPDETPAGGLTLGDGHGFGRSDTEIIKIPVTAFSCAERQSGYYADRDISCRVFHYCNDDRGIRSFICPTCTLFDDERQLCDYWYNVQCQVDAS